MLDTKDYSIVTTFGMLTVTVQVKGGGGIPEEDPGVVVAVVHEEQERGGSTGSASPPLACTGAALIASEPRRTM